MKKQPEITEKTRNMIVDTFCAMYERNPIEKIYVKDVISQAGYNRSTFYQYFPDIYALRDYVENDVMETIRAKAGQKDNDIAQLMEFYRQKEKYLRALFGAYGSMHFFDRMKEELAQRMETQLSGIKDEIKPYVMEYHMVTTLSLFRLWVAKG